MMEKSRTRVPSPARSLGSTLSPRRLRTRASRSVGSPTRSVSPPLRLHRNPRLSAVIRSSQSSLSSSLGSKKSILKDNTQVETPKRRSWPKRLGDQSTDIQAVLESERIEDDHGPFEQIAEPNIVASNYPNKNPALDIMEESISVSFGSINVPQRKLFNHRQTQRANKFENIPTTRDMSKKSKKYDIDRTLTVNVAKIDLFAKTKSKEIQNNYPQLLDNVTSNTTGKRIDNIEADVMKKNLFGNKPKTNKPSAFINFIMSESEDDTTSLQGEIMTFGKSTKLVTRPLRDSLASRTSKRPSSPASSAVSEHLGSETMDFESWKSLFSSTKVGEDLAVGLTPVKKLRSTYTVDGKTTYSIDGKISEISPPESWKSRRSNNSRQNATLTSKNKSTREDVQQNERSLRSNATAEVNEIGCPSKHDNEVCNRSGRSASILNKSKANRRSNRTIIDASGNALNNDNELIMENYDNNFEVNNSVNKSTASQKNGKNNSRKNTSNDEHQEMTRSLRSRSKINTSNDEENAFKTKDKLLRTQDNVSAEKSLRNTTGMSINQAIIEEVNAFKTEDNLNSSEAIIVNKINVNQICKSTRDEIIDDSESIFKTKDKLSRTVEKLAAEKSIRNQTAHEETDNEVGGICNNDEAKLDNLNQMEASVLNEIQHNVEIKIDEVNKILYDVAHSKIQEGENDESAHNNDSDEELEQKSILNFVSEEDESEDEDLNKAKEDSEHEVDENEQHEESDKLQQNEISEQVIDENEENYEGANENSEEEDEEQIDADNEEREADYEEPECEANNYETEREADDEEPECEANNEEPEREADDEEPECEADNEVPERDADDKELECETNNEEPERDAYDEEPECEADNEKPECEADNEEPESEADDEEPECEANNEGPERDAYDEEPEGEVDNEKPESEADNEDPESEADNDEPESEADNDEPESEADNEEPESEADNEEPESEADNEDPQSEAYYEESENEVDLSGKENISIVEKETHSSSHYENNDNIRDNEQDNRSIHSKSTEKVNQGADQMQENRVSRIKNKSKTELANESKRMKLNTTENNVGRPSDTENLNRESGEYSKNSTGVRSSTEGSGWDSHTTHLQKFGELTMQNRKSLRAMVLSKSANTRFEKETNDISKVSEHNAPDFSIRNNSNYTLAHENMNTFGKNTTMEKYYIQKIREENLLQKEKIQQKVMGCIVASLPDVNHEAEVARNVKWNNFKKPKTPAPKIMKEKAKAAVKSYEDKAPKLFKPPRAEWVTKRLYKYLETKLTPKYRLDARIRSEKFVRILFEINKELMKMNCTREIQIFMIKQLQNKMAKMRLVDTYFEFYNFVEEFMPKEFRIKVIPNVFNRLPQPSQGIFSRILSTSHSSEKDG